MNAERVYFCGVLRKIYTVFGLATLEKLMKELLGGSNIFMKSNPRVSGDKPLISIRYKYRSQKVLGFIYTEGARSNEPGVSRFRKSQ